MYPSDTKLEASLDHYRSMILFLTEVKETRELKRFNLINAEQKEQKKREFEAGLPHRALSWIRDTIKKPRGGVVVKISSVTCVCGAIINYKKPLNTIEDFICPNSTKRLKDAR